MYVRPLRLSDIDKINSLNPAETNDLGFLKRSPRIHNSKGIFVDGELKAYMIMDKKNFNSTYSTLRSIYYTNAKHLIILFANIAFDNTRVYFSLEENQYFVILSLIKKIASRFKIELSEKADGLFNGYMMAEEGLSFVSPYFNILKSLYSKTELCLSIYPYFDSLTDFLSPLELEKIKNYALTQLHKRNKDYLTRIHPDFLVLAHSSTRLRKNKETNFIQSLEEKGFICKKKGNLSVKSLDNHKYPFFDLEKSYVLSDQNIIDYYKILSFKGVSLYPNTFSYYRFFIGRMITNLRKHNHAKRYWLLDQEGYPLFEIYKESRVKDYVPLNFKNAFYSKIKAYALLWKISSMVNEHINENIVNPVRYKERYYSGDFFLFAELLRKYISDEEVYSFYVDLIKKESFDLTDDYNRHHLSDSLDGLVYPHIRIIKLDMFLTKKALKNTLLHADDGNILKPILSILEHLKEVAKDEDISFLRQEISKQLKKRVHFESIFSIYKEYILNHYKTTLSDSKQEFFSLIELFIEANKGEEDLRYSHRSNLYMLVKRRKNKAFLSFVLKIVRVFQEKAQINIFQAVKHGLSGYPFSVLEEIKQLHGTNFSLSVVKVWANHYRISTNDSTYMYFHDTGYVYESLNRLHQLLDKETFLFLLKHYSLEELRTQSNILNSIENYHVGNDKEIIKSISANIKTRTSLLPILNLLQQDYEKNLLSKYDSDGLITPDIYNPFIQRMKVYQEEISLTDILNVFEEEAIPILLGEKEGTFTPSDYLLPNTKLGMIIQQALGKRGEGAMVRNPKRLYKRLNGIYPVSDMISGNIPSIHTNAILELLKSRGMEVPKEVEITPFIRGKIEPKCSPEFLMAGNASVCCMSFGAENAIDYALQKGFGVFNIYFKERIIANSVLWINSFYNSLVIDNVEVHPNYTKFNPYIKEIYLIMIKDVLNQYGLDFAVQGLSYSDLHLFDKTYRIEHFIEGKDINEDFYTDADYASPIYSTTMAPEVIGGFIHSRNKEKGKEKNVVRPIAVATI